MAIEVFERWNISWYFEDFGHEVLLSFTDNAAVEKLCRHNRPAIDVFNDPRFVDARLRKTAKIAKHKSINPAQYAADAHERGQHGYTDAQYAYYAGAMPMR